MIVSLLFGWHIKNATPNSKEKWFKIAHTTQKKLNQLKGKSSFENLCEFLCLNRAEEKHERREMAITWRKDGVVWCIKNCAFPPSHRLRKVTQMSYFMLNKNYESIWTALKNPISQQQLFSPVLKCCWTFEQKLFAHETFFKGKRNRNGHEGNLMSRNCFEYSSRWKFSSAFNFFFCESQRRWIVDA